MELVTVDVAAVADVPVAQGLAVTAEGREIAVFRLGDEFVAYQGSCLHRGSPLADGMCRDGVVTCPAHWWRYDLRSGSRVDAPDLRLARYPVIARGGRLLLTVPLAAAPGSVVEPAEGWRDRLLRLAREETASVEGNR